ncbi:MAG: sulfate adenylyltransferase [Armatimonadetes bacterium]|nr:sulfate adenylyltransferase [Armatimonadota bacterium]
MQTFGARPHGGVLVDRLAATGEREALAHEAAGLRQVELTARQAADLEILAIGAASPLDGFMRESDYRSVVDSMRLANGLVWTLPITLAPALRQDEMPEVGTRVALVDAGGPLAVMDVESIYARNKVEEAESVFATADPSHPGVAGLFAEGDTLFGGALHVIRLPGHAEFVDYYLTPRQTRAVFADRGWRTVVGFQTRNPVHRAHEYLQKCALEMVDGLLLHPLVGETKGDDIPAAVRMQCYQALLKGYYPPERVLLSVNPAFMRYAGPREAVFHALIRKNYGCTHFIVGRDHAGVGNWYGTYDAQAIFDRFSSEELGIVPLKFEHSFWCRACGGMASPKTCPHGSETRTTLSGTRVREMLAAGEPLPTEFTRAEVAAVLSEYSRG